MINFFVGINFLSVKRNEFFIRRGKFYRHKIHVVEKLLPTTFLPISYSEPCFYLFIFIYNYIHCWSTMLALTNKNQWQ